MRITINRHPGAPNDKDTIETTYATLQPREASYRRGYADDRITIDTDVADVEITENFLGVMFVTRDGERLAVAHRDTGFELMYRPWKDDDDPIHVDLKAGTVSHSDEAAPEPWLGLATNRQLIEELSTRWAMGSVHPDYSTMTGERFGTEEYTSGEFTVAASPPNPHTGYRFDGSTPAPKVIATIDEDVPLEVADDDVQHRDPWWAVPDEPWTPALTKCYECGGFGTIRSDVEGVNMSVVCNDCNGTGLADPPGDQMVTAVFQAIGGGSMCWEHVSRAGVFHSERAKWIGDGLVEWLRANGWHQG